MKVKFCVEKNQVYKTRVNLCNYIPKFITLEYHVICPNPSATLNLTLNLTLILTLALNLTLRLNLILSLSLTLVLNFTLTLVLNFTLTLPLPLTLSLSILVSLPISLSLSVSVSQFSDPLLADATDLRVERYAWYYILEMLGGILFMDKSSERLSVMYLQFFNPISNGKKYRWGSAALSWLYRRLYKASNNTMKQSGSVLLLVQLWAYAGFPHICLVMRHPQQALPPPPPLQSTYY